MNKPATKEPSMDEILSSIRQIIADDDAAASPPVRPAPKDPAPVAAAPIVPPRASGSEPLALSPSQILPKTEPVRPPPPPMPAPPLEPEAVDFDMPMGEAELLDPEDIAFESDPEPVAPPPPPVAPPPVMRAAPQPAPPPPRPAATVVQAAPMPDPTLSSDMAEELLAPATNAAVQSTFAKLGSLSTAGAGSQTIEGMMREMLRPMLKDWLDENLPAVVERMVEREIARVSRGVK